jgi:hypothetical protein
MTPKPPLLTCFDAAENHPQNRFPNPTVMSPAGESKHDWQLIVSVILVAVSVFGLLYIWVWSR